MINTKQSLRLTGLIQIMKPMRGIMDITCLNCAAVYEIDDTTVTTSGRKVRCAACNAVWRVYRSDRQPGDQQEATQTNLSAIAQTKPIQGIQDKDTQAIDTQAIDTQANLDSRMEIISNSDGVHQEESQSAPRRVKWAKDKKPEKQVSWMKGTLMTWPTLAIASAVCVIGIGLQQRERIVRFLPQAAKAYAAIGLQVNLRGIEIKGVSSRIIDDNGVSVLVVDGDLLNVTQKKLDVPRLRFAVLGQAGQEVFVWSAQADRSSLQPGEVLNFRRRLAAPPQEGKDVSVRFVTRADISSGIK